MSNVLDLVEKSVRDAWFMRKFFVILTTFDESKYLNRRKERVTNAACFGGEKKICYSKRKMNGKKAKMKSGKKKNGNLNPKSHFISFF